MQSQHAMNRVLELVKLCKAEDNLKPRPKVAAVIVDSSGNIIGEAHRGQITPGEHAEYTLLERILKGKDLKGCTAYVSLEPCSLRSHNKTPCSQRLISRGIEKVYIANLDPNPFIRGNGVQRLLKEGVQVAFFDKEIADLISLENNEFINEYYSDSIYRIDDFIVEQQERSMDAWYNSLVSIYKDRNFAFSISTIFMHLSESIGDLVKEITVNEKIDSKKYNKLIAKSFAWTFALCQKAGIESIEKMIILKYPYVCPYCLSYPHNGSICKNNGQNMTIDWSDLIDRMSAIEIGKTPNDYADMFNNIYPCSTEITLPLSKLVEELGELAEACRYISEHEGYFWSECADVIAWLYAIHNTVQKVLSERISINVALAQYYPDACRDCGQIKCGCPLLDKSHISLLSGESPTHDIIHSAKQYIHPSR